MIFNKSLYLFFPSRKWKILFFVLLGAVFLFQIGALLIYLKLKSPMVESRITLEAKSIDTPTERDLSLITSQEDSSSRILSAIIEDIELKAVTVRPDRLHERKGIVFLKRAQEEVIINHEKPLYVFFDDLGGMRLTAEKIASPLILIPLISNKEVIFKIEDHFVVDIHNRPQAEKQIVLKPKGDEKTVNSLKERFSKIKVIHPDLFLTTYGDLKNHPMTLVLQDCRAILDNKNQVYFDGYQFKHQPDENYDLIQVKTINTQKLAIICYDASGFYSVQFTQDLKSKEKGYIPHVEPPKQAVMRGVDAVSCVFQGKKTHIKKGDFFVYEENTWRKIVSLEEFNELIAYKLLNEILVVEDIYAEDRIISISGKIFDQSRWYCSPFNWKLELKKEKKAKDNIKNQPATSQPLEPLDMQDKNESEDIF